MSHANKQLATSYLGLVWKIRKDMMI